MSTTNEPGRSRQRDVYVAGMRGRTPLLPAGTAALEEAAARVLTPEAFAYLAGGAGAETTGVANRRGLDRWQWVPRVMRDVASRDLSVELFGARLPAPLLLAPIGVLDLAHRDADLAVGRAASAMGIPFVFSNQASVPMEDVARAMGDGPRWFQLYWSRSNGLVESFVQRAERCGCTALVVTVDTTLLGWRTRDLDLGYLPFLRGRGIANYVSDPVFMELVRSEPRSDELDEGGLPGPSVLKNAVELLRNYPGSSLRALRSGEALAAVRKFIEVYSRPNLNWSDLSFLRRITKLPIILKGILHPEDARIAVDHGADGIVVSNHGGRQVDGAASAIDQLGPVVDAVEDRVPVLMDSGIRGGSDVLKALALGARAVLLGRPYAYGLAVGGEAGVREVLANVLAEVDLTLGLLGAPSVGDLNRSFLRLDTD